jgi:hypothetical protein
MQVAMSENSSAWNSPSHAAQRVHFDLVRAVDLAEVARAEDCPLRARGRHDREDLTGEPKSAENLARCRPGRQ